MMDNWNKLSFQQCFWVMVTSYGLKNPTHFGLWMSPMNDSECCHFFLHIVLFILMQRHHRHVGGKNIGIVFVQCIKCLLQMNCARVMLCRWLTYTVPPKVPQSAVVSSTQKIDIPIMAAAGMLVAVTRNTDALWKLAPQAGIILTHCMSMPTLLDHFLNRKNKPLSKWENHGHRHHVLLQPS